MALPACAADEQPSDVPTAVHRYKRDAADNVKSILDDARLHEYGRTDFHIGFLRFEAELVSMTKPSGSRYLNYEELLRPNLFRYPKGLFISIYFWCAPGYFQFCQVPAKDYPISSG